MTKTYRPDEVKMFISGVEIKNAIVGELEISDPKQTYTAAQQKEFWGFDVAEAITNAVEKQYQSALQGLKQVKCPTCDTSRVNLGRHPGEFYCMNLECERWFFKSER